jgi:hypothetical protein
MKAKVFTIFCALLLTMGCSKNDDSVESEQPVQQEKPTEPAPVEVLTGKFIDSWVQGLLFSTATQSGITSLTGEFKFVEGEEITFKVGNVVIGKLIAQAEITPITIAQTSNANATIENDIAKNIAAFLQTLDIDQDHSNGITISPDIVNALGVETIDFSSNIIPILADIVLSVSRQTGYFLKVVYPEMAAINMATALDIEYTAQENLALSHLLPFIESLYAADIPKSAVFKNTFNEDGTLLSTSIILRYSGRVLYDFNFSNYNNVGLPTTATSMIKSPNLLGGSWSYPVTQEMSDYSIQYNGEHQVEKVTLNNTQESSESSESFIVVSEWNDENKAVTYSDNYSTGSAFNQTATFTNSFNNGLLISQNEQWVTVTNDVTYGYYSESEYTETTTFAHNDKGNFSQINSSVNGSSSWGYENEEPTDYNYSSEEQWNMVYREDNTLQELNQSTTRITQDETFSYGNHYIFNVNELLITQNYTTNGFERISTFQDGVLINSQNFDDGLLTNNTTYEMDGSFVELKYVYDDTSEISYSLINTWILTGAGYYDVIKTEYFDANGVLTDYTTYEFYDSGVVKETASFNADGELFWIDYYDTNGFWVKEEYYDAGVLYFTYIYENDNNGNRINAEGYNTDGILELIYYYNEQGYVSSIDFYSGDSIEETAQYYYDENNYLMTIQYVDAEGVLKYLESYDEFGYLAYYEYYEQGILVEYYIYNYNNINGLETVEGFYSDGVLFLIEYYEQGVLIRIDYYDEEGNIIDTYNHSGKSLSDYESRTVKYTRNAKGVVSLNVKKTTQAKRIKLQSAKRLHNKHQSKIVKRVIKSKYALRDKDKREQF